MAAVPKAWTGYAFQSTALKVWDGTTWQAKPAYWDGSAWVDLYVSGGTYTVGLGSDRTENDGDTAPYDSRAGYRLNYNSNVDGFQETGNSPGGGGAISSWTDDGDIATPTGYTSSDFEYQWVEVSDDGVSSKVTPVAASTWDTFDGTKTWYCTRTTAGVKTWVIDVTVREIADTGNTDTVRITMNVEGII